MFKYSGILKTCYKPLKWEIFNIPPKTNTGYSSIFNQKRDFQLSIEKLTIEVPNWSKMNSCCILDESVNGQSIDVIFLDEYDCYTCLALRLLIQKQLWMKNSNSLLVLLNKLKKGRIFKLQNTFIYIKCAASEKWPLFYDLFEFLIKRLGRSFIGSQFYINFICKELIYKELFFLQKIKENQDFANFVLFASECQTREMKDTEITSSMKQYGKNVCSEYKPKVGDGKILAYKRTILECKNLFVDQNNLFKSSRNSLQKDCIKCRKNKWQCFGYHTKYVHNYTNILEVKGIFNELEFTPTSVDFSIYSSSVPKDSLEVKEINLIPGSSVNTTVIPSNKTKEISFMVKLNHTVLETGVKGSDVSNNASDKCITKESTIKKTNDFSQRALENNESTGSEIFSNNADHKTCEIKPRNANSPKIFFEKAKCNQKDSSFAMFQTANGKALKISEQALQLAQKMYSEVCSQVIDSTKNEENGSFSNSQKKVENLNYKQNSGFSSASKSTLNNAYFGDNVDNRFFEEISFDEEVNQCGLSSSVLPSICFKSQSGRVRKSLGGRRSLKPYVKKS